MANNEEVARESNLLACPFCGGEAYFNRAKNGTQMARVGCASCGVSVKCAVFGYGEDAPLSKDIVAIWNRRAYPPLPADLGELMANGRWLARHHKTLENDATVAVLDRLCDVLEAAHSGTAITVKPIGLEDHPIYGGDY